MTVRFSHSLDLVAGRKWVTAAPRTKRLRAAVRTENPTAQIRISGREPCPRGRGPSERDRSGGRGPTLNSHPLAPRRLREFAATRGARKAGHRRREQGGAQRSEGAHNAGAHARAATSCGRSATSTSPAACTPTRGWSRGPRSLAADHRTAGLMPARHLRFGEGCLCAPHGTRLSAGYSALKRVYAAAYASAEPAWASPEVRRRASFLQLVLSSESVPLQRQRAWLRQKRGLLLC